MDLSQPQTDLTRGVWLVDKAVGPTSHDLILAARRTLGIPRIGHTGTLDPFASGLLILCVGKVTRLVEYFHELPKTYLATVHLGEETTTDDPTGDITASTDAWKKVTYEALQTAMEVMTGTIDQVPPTYSAKRLRGRRAYQKARDGEEFSLDPQQVTIHELQLESYDPPVVRLSAVVSTGTYVRAIARDLGRALGCGGHLSALRRTSIGPFRVQDAVDPATFDDLAAAACRPKDVVPGWLEPERALAWLPAVHVSPEEAEHIRQGRRIEAPIPGSGTPVVLYEGGRLLALAQRDGVSLKPEKVFIEG